MVHWRGRLVYGVPALAVLAVLAFVGAARSGSTQSGSPESDLVARGRQLVVTRACAGCHGGVTDPAMTGWLAGETSPDLQFLIGPCYLEPGAEPCFHTHPRNLTPDNETGMGRFTERQIFNALRYGLRPEDTPDVEITSTTPGEGNFPRHPRYLAVPMPWMAWRHMPDEDLWAIAAYLKRAVKPVHNEVPESEGPPDFWASAYTVEEIGPYPAAAFPTENERVPKSITEEMGDRIARGRYLVISHDCAGCHGGGSNPAASGWLTGETTPEMQFLIGPCYLDREAEPCFHTHPRNLTPDDETGIGRFTERQIFNALRYGLRPEDTPDVEITSTTPGEGNFPTNPRYLAPPMPWWAYRSLPDEDLWAIAAYLKQAVKPVHNEVPESEGPPDFWADAYTPDKIGPYPASPFPTENERVPAEAEGGAGTK